MEHANPASRLANHPALVLVVYAFVILPLGLYVYKDIIDSHWRRVQLLHLSWFMYTGLYLVCGLCIAAYSVIQLRARDYKEVGSACVALLLGAYGFWKLLRLRKILKAHRTLVHEQVRLADTILLALLPDEQTGDTARKAASNFRINYDDKPFQWSVPPICTVLRTRARISSGTPHTGSVALTVTEDDSQETCQDEPRAHYISSALFDDDYPGQDTARIKWLRWDGRPQVHPEDAHLGAMRVALFLRLALRPPTHKLWTVLITTHKLVAEASAYLSLGRILRRLVVDGSDANEHSKVHLNPLEYLLQHPHDEQDQECVGVGFFWIATKRSPDELARDLAIFPHQWIRGYIQNAPQLVLEICTLLILAKRFDRTHVQAGHCLTLPSCTCLAPRRQDMDDNASGVAQNEAALQPVAPHVLEDTPLKSRDHRLLSASFSSWDDILIHEVKRKAITARCAHSVASLLEKNSDHGVCMNGAQERTFDDVIQCCTDVLGKAFLRMSKPDIFENYPEVDGTVVGCAVQEMIITSQYSGCVVEAVIGSELCQKLKKHGEYVTIAKCEIVFGLAAIAAQLQLGEEAMRSLTTSWRTRWRYERVIPDGSILEVVRHKTLLEHRSQRRLTRSGAEWMLSERGYRCPNHLEAFVVYAQMACDLAEGVFVAFHSWVQRGEDECVKLKFPKAKLGSPRHVHENWMRWKRMQGSPCPGSSFAR